MDLLFTFMVIMLPFILLAAFIGWSKAYRARVTRAAIAARRADALRTAAILMEHFGKN